MFKNKIFITSLLSLFLTSALFAMPLQTELLGQDPQTHLNYYKVSIFSFEHSRGQLLQSYLEKNNAGHDSIVPLEKALSPFYGQFVNRYAATPNANCFNSSFASIVSSYWPERFMSTNEMICQLQNNTSPVSQWEFGDIAVLYNGGLPIHAMTYLGWDKNSPNDHFVFSKIGNAAETRYLVTKLSPLMKLYASRDLRFYRLKNLFVQDPAVASEQSSCFEDYKKFSRDFGQYPDPDIY